MQLITEINHSHKCCYRIIQKGWHFIEKWDCNKDAIYTNNGKFYCKRHSKMQRFVFREMLYPDGKERGYTEGKILVRFDTIEELNSNKHLYPNTLAQKVTRSHRRDLYINTF